jgi:DnaK suppressor protein
MSPDVLAACAVRLNDMKQDLLRQMAMQHGDCGGRAEATAQARAELQEDERVAAVEMEVSMALGDREVVELNEVEAALTRVEQGRYGACIDCGAEVAFARLLVAPAAARCIACQSALEGMHGQPHFATL